MAIGVLAGPTKTGTGTTAITSSAFTPPDKCLVVVLAAAGWSSTHPVTLALTDSGSHTWTTRASISGATSNGGAAYIFSSYFATSPGSITLTLTATGFGTGGGLMLDAWPLTGCAPSQTGAASATASRTSTDGTITLTSTLSGSMILGVNDDATSSTTFTVNGNTTQSFLFNDTTDNVGMVSWDGSFFTGIPGSVTYGGTWGATADNNIAVLEVLPLITGPIQLVAPTNSYH